MAHNVMLLFYQPHIAHNVMLLFYQPHMAHNVMLVIYCPYNHCELSGAVLLDKLILAQLISFCV